MKFFSVNVPKLIKSSPIFKGLTVIEREKIDALIFIVEPSLEQDVLPTHMMQDSVFFVCQGNLIISEISPERKLLQTHIIKEGHIWCGLQEIKGDPHSTFRLEFESQAEIKRLRLSDLYYQIDYHRIFDKLCKNIGYKDKDEIRITDAKYHIQLALFQKEEGERQLVATQYYISGILSILCLYIVMLNFAQFITQNIGTPPITFGFCLIGAAFYTLVIKKSQLPLAAIGFTFANTKVAVIEGILGSIVLCIAALSLKWILITFVPEFKGLSLISVSSTYHSLGSLHAYILSIFCYALLSSVLQEVIFRGVIQGLLQTIYIGNKTMWTPIFLSTMIFSCAHIVISPAAVLIVLVPGFCWSWLFSRHHNLIGVCLSHATFGTASFFVFGYLDIMQG